MPFAYYERLSARDRAIYRRSDSVTTLVLKHPRELQPLVEGLRLSLASELIPDIGAASKALALGLADQLELPPVRLEVLAVRPTADWGELHGLYTREAGRTPRIQLWMRTAHHKRLVAFRTFLRTLLHEVGHHVDYERLELADSFHTEGFFRRESSLFHQLVPSKPGPASSAGGSPAGEV